MYYLHAELTTFEFLLCSTINFIVCIYVMSISDECMMIINDGY